MTTPQICCDGPGRLQGVLARLRAFYRAWVMLREARYAALQAILDDTDAPRRAD
jgi:hypothetical protein